MQDPNNLTILCAVEGIVDEAVARRLVREVGANPGAVYGKKGKAHLCGRLSGYNRAAEYNNWLVLIDLDQDAVCAPAYIRLLRLTIAPRMYLRIAVREVESWLLADSEKLADYLRVSPDLIPRDPESVADPKAMMVALAARSRMRAVREDMVPRPGSRRTIGPAYPSRLIEFADKHWRPLIASRCSDSLNRAVRRLRSILAE